MGQRHQVFIKANHSYDTQKVILGLHHQWLYGGTAIKRLCNILEYDANASEYTNFSKGKGISPRETSNIFRSIYSINSADGYYHSVIDLNASIPEYGIDSVSPEAQDNNDGQTFIDFSNGKPKLCFAFPYDKDIYQYSEDSDGEVEETVVGQYKSFVPISPLEYFKLYYSVDTAEDADEKEFVDSILVILENMEDTYDLMTQEELNSFVLDTQNKDLVLY